MLICLTAINIVIPLLLGMVFDRVFPEKNWVLLFVVLTELLTAYLARNFFYYYSKSTAVRIGEEVCVKLRSKLFQHLQSMNISYHHTTDPGNLSSRILNDTNLIKIFIQSQLPRTIQSVLLFFGLLVTMYVINWPLAAATTVVLPLHLMVFKYFKPAIQSASHDAQSNLAGATGNLMERFLGLEVVKSFTAEQREADTFHNSIQLARHSELRGKKYQVQQKVLADLLIGAGTILLVGFGAYQVMGPNARNALSAGEFIAFFWFVKMLYPTVLELINNFGKLFKSFAGVERAFEVLGECTNAESILDDERATPPILGKISFRSVFFSYREEIPLLKEISFTIDPGTTCALTGKSGVGKSTLINLIPRFIVPDRGRIALDNIDISKINTQHLRSHIGIAFQDCFLFRTTVMENLKYANPEMSTEKTLELMKRIGIEDLIDELPNGYNTIVGKGGVRLSRGQKQKISLARAMLKDPQILIMDEATVSIDDEREEQIVSSILEIMKNRTVIMVTFDPRLMQKADFILEIKNGTIEEYSSSDSLVESELSGIK